MQRWELWFVVVTNNGGAGLGKRDENFGLGGGAG